MKEKATKNVDELVDKMMRSSRLETPSFNFTDVVMQHIVATSENKVTAYKPLISKTVWGFILVGFISIVIYAVFAAQTETTGWLDAVDYSLFSNNKISHMLANLKFPNTVISKTFVYAFVFLAVMVCIQIPILKHHFNQRFEN